MKPDDPLSSLSDRDTLPKRIPTTQGGAREGLGVNSATVQGGRIAQYVEDLLKRALESLGASSATFYVLDPWFPSELRLACMPGVKYIEPMHGFVFPRSSIQRVSPKSPEEAERYYTSEEDLSELRDRPTLRLAQLIAQSRLFANFVDREAVKACARLVGSDGNGSIQSVLWINYSQRRDYTESDKTELRALSVQMNDLAPSVVDEIRSSNPFPAEQVLGLAKAAEEAPAISANPEKYLESVLKAVMGTFSMTPENGMGVVYMYDPKKQVLRRGAVYGNAAIYRDDLAEMPIGKGVASWVFARRRSLLIDNLQLSSFVREKIYVNTAEGVKSLLAVPLIVADYVSGVLILESMCEHVFTPHSVRAVWYGANQVATACRLSDLIRAKDVILDTAHRVSIGKNEGRPLDELAEAARSLVGSARCVIWRYDCDCARFDGVGSTVMDEDEMPRPRIDGWSRWIVDHRVPVGLTGIVGERAFDASAWRAERWERLSRRDTAPETVHGWLVRLGVDTELGVPIEVHGQILGVAWFMFDGHDQSVLSSQTIHLALRFAAQCGLVIEAARHRAELAGQEEMLNAQEELSSKILRTGKIAGFPCVSGYVLSRPFGARIGGDFCLAERVDRYRAALVLGDAKGHGLVADLRMLPMATTFKIVARESFSPKHILSRMLSVMNEMSLDGTAVCLVVDASGVRGGRPMRTLYAASAGHPSLLVISGREDPYTIPHGSTANAGQFGLDASYPFGEEFLSLNPGDLIIAYTDGVVEDNHVGMQRMDIVRCVLENRKRSPEDIAEAIMEEAHAGSRRQDDDATVLVLRISEDPDDVGGVS